VRVCTALADFRITRVAPHARNQEGMDSIRPLRDRYHLVYTSLGCLRTGSPTIQPVSTNDPSRRVYHQPPPNLSNDPRSRGRYQWLAVGAGESRSTQGLWQGHPPNFRSQLFQFSWTGRGSARLEIADFAVDFCRGTVRGPLVLGDQQTMIYIRCPELDPTNHIRCRR